MSETVHKYSLRDMGKRPTDNNKKVAASRSRTRRQNPGKNQGAMEELRKMAETMLQKTKDERKIFNQQRGRGPRPENIEVP